MRDLVIIPAYDRPEYLALCLEKLFKARGIAEKEIWVCVDHHLGTFPDPEIVRQNMRVILDAMNARSDVTIRVIHREPHATYGNSFNVLEAFREAYATDARYVYLLEDDVLVTPDYFEWHEQAQEMWHPFVSCAGRINRSLNFAMNGPEAIDETYKSPLACVASPRAYGSWAACFTQQFLGLILKEADNQDFLKHVGPGNEQDIFIQKFMPRVQIYKSSILPLAFQVEDTVYPSYLLQSAFSVWPYVPRAYHMGWYSYHRTAGMKFNGTLEEKVAALRSAVSDPQKIKAMACLQEIDPYPTAPVDTWQGSLFLKADYRKKA